MTTPLDRRRSSRGWPSLWSTGGNWKIWLLLGQYCILLFYFFLVYFSDHIQNIGSIRFFFFLKTLTKTWWLCILPRIGIWKCFGFLVFSGQRLEESLEYQQFVANVEEEEAWINEKLNLVGSEDYGDTLAAVQVWKNKPHLADYGLSLDAPSYCC